MSENTAKINLKIGQIEISIEGPSEFVSNQYDKVEAHLKTYSEMSSKMIKPKVEPPVDEQNPADSNLQQAMSLNGLPDSFGQWLNIIPKETSDTDKAILAGYFTQLTSLTKRLRQEM